LKTHRFREILLSESKPEMSFVEASWKRQEENRSVKPAGLAAM